MHVAVGALATYQSSAGLRCLGKPNRLRLGGLPLRIRNGPERRSGARLGGARCRAATSGAAIERRAVHPFRREPHPCIRERLADIRCVED